jgi:hypothetical protein
MWHAFVTTDPALSPDATGTAATSFADRIASDAGSELVVATREPGQATSCRPSAAADNASSDGEASVPSSGDADAACIELVDPLNGVDRVSVRVDGDQPPESSVSTALLQAASSFSIPQNDGQGVTTRR